MTAAAVAVAASNDRSRACLGAFREPGRQKENSANTRQKSRQAARMPVNRPAGERTNQPREYPLSEDDGTLCASYVATSDAI
eukprot:jgi/Psemu1/300488/fgenesh1_kg.13_\